MKAHGLATVGRRRIGCLEPMVEAGASLTRSISRGVGIERHPARKPGGTVPETPETLFAHGANIVSLLFR